MKIIIDDLKQRQNELKREFHFPDWSTVYRMTGFRLRLALKLLKKIRYTDAGVVAVDGWFVKDGTDPMTTKELLLSRACLRAYLDGVEEARQNPELPFAAYELSDYGRLVNKIIEPVFDAAVNVLQDVMAFLDKGVRVRYDDVNDVIEFPGATVRQAVRLYSLVSLSVTYDDRALEVYSQQNQGDEK